MGIIQNIKYQYKLKLIEDLIKNSKYSELREILSNYCKDNPIEGFTLIKNFIPKFISITSDEKILNDNIVLINSFLIEDANVISNFIDYYFKKLNIINFKISNYQNELIKLSNVLKKNELIHEEDLFQNSLYYQSIMTYLGEETLKIMTNQCAYFSSKTGIDFTNTRLTKCYFLLIEHPYAIYQKIKDKVHSKDLAMNEFLNLDDKPLSLIQENKELKITRKGWGIYTNSWSDPNVANTLKGSILKIEHYKENPEEFFGSIILHLRQSGYEVALNYSVISDYISTITSKNDDIDVNISNHEKKALRRHIESVSDNFEYNL